MSRDSLYVCHKTEPAPREGVGLVERTARPASRLAGDHLAQGNGFQFRDFPRA